MTQQAHLRRTQFALALIAVCGACGAVRGGEQPADSGTDASSVGIDAGDSDASSPSTDAASPPPDASTLGMSINPAASCADLLTALGPVSGVYWVKNPDGHGAPFQVYCEQQLEQGGWALLYNSVRRADGTTTAFWNIPYVQRFTTKGIPAPGQNYYQGNLYLSGTQYMDVFTDLAGTVAKAAVVHASGVNVDSMAFISPALISGNPDVFAQEFNAGWSSPDHAGDTSGANCAQRYSSVTQHYGACWAYNLGADADPDTPFLDGGVGPHVSSNVLTALKLAVQPTGGKYSQVARIARFTRW